VRGSDYNQQKSQLSQIARKQTGSLAVRDLSTIISEKDVINTENLLTLFVVVPRHVKKEWLATYESITEYIVRLLAILRAGPVKLESWESVAFYSPLFFGFWHHCEVCKPRFAASVLLWLSTTLSLPQHTSDINNNGQGSNM